MIAEWGFNRNTNRAEVIKILRQKEQRHLIGKESTFTSEGRPVDMEKVERYRKREFIHVTGNRSLFKSLEGTKTKNLICKTPPPLTSPYRPLRTPQVWHVSEKLFYDVDVYIKGSFESDAWVFNGNERLIESSHCQPLERDSLHAFLGALDTGCTNKALGKYGLAGLYWRRAFVEIESLVKGSYHDIIPNVIQKLNDLNDQGCRAVAIKMKNHIASLSMLHQSPNNTRMCIFKAFADVDIDHLVELEARIMSRFTELFELYLGSQCYNSFVMFTNAARRRLNRNRSTNLDECLPVLSDLDDAFGPSNRRPLDVIRLRADVLYQRGMYPQAETEGTMLIHRAEMIENDEWQRLYFLVHGWTCVGSAQCLLGKETAAMASLSHALKLEEEFCMIDTSGLFNPEKFAMLGYLEELGTRIQHDHVADWRSQRAQVVRDLEATDELQYGDIAASIHVVGAPSDGSGAHYLAI